MVNPIMIDVPESFETERLLIHAARAGDGKDVAEAVNETIEQLGWQMPWVQRNRTPEEAEEGCRKAYQSYLARTDLRMHIYHKESGTFVGGLGLHRIDWRVPKFEIGYWCRLSMQRQGYIIEAARALVDLAFSQLNAERIELQCDTENTRSKNIADKLAFVYEGTLRHNHKAPNGTYRNSLVFSMLRSEWETTRTTHHSSQ